MVCVRQLCCELVGKDNDTDIQAGGSSEGSVLIHQHPGVIFCCPAHQCSPWRDPQGWPSPHSGLKSAFFCTSRGFWWFYLQLVEFPLNICFAFQLPSLWYHLQVCPSCWWPVGVQAQLLSQAGHSSFPAATQTKTLIKNNNNKLIKPLCTFVQIPHGHCFCSSISGLIEGWETAQAHRFGLELGCSCSVWASCLKLTELWDSKTCDSRTCDNR